MVTVALLGGITTALGLSGCVSQMVYPGAKPNALTPDSVYSASHPDAKPYIHRLSDGTELHGWLVRAQEGAPLVVMYAGNGMSAGDFLPFAMGDTTHSYLLLNYRGYGNSEGEPSEKQLVKDACEVLMAMKWQYHPSSVTLVGFSLGTGVAVQAAARTAGRIPVQSLVLICPFDSMENVACDKVPLLPRLFMEDKYDSAAYAPQITCPVTVFRATHDEIVSAERTNTLIRSFGRPVNAIDITATHNTILSTPGFAEKLYSVLAH